MVRVAGFAIFLRTIEIFVFFERRFRFCVLALCTRIKAMVAYTHRNHSKEGD